MPTDDPASQTDGSPPSGGEGKKFSVVRLWPLAVLLAGLVLFFALGFDKYVTFDALRENREELLDLVARHAVLGGLLFILVYVAVAAFSLPVGAITSITGGFLFGNVLGTLYIVIGATIGASLLFLAAKTSIGDALREKAGPGIRRMIWCAQKRR